jgi:uncharacterized membrane protein YheB (UPF0754 family)
MRTLYEISEDLRALYALLEEEEGEVSNTETAFDQWFAELGTERNKKLENYAHLIMSIEVDAKALKDEIDRLKARKTAFDNKAKRLKERLEYHFKSHDIDRIETEKFTFAMQKPGGKPKFILSDYFEAHPEELPEGLRRVKFEPDLNEIKEMVEKDPENYGIYGTHAEVERRLRIK